MKKQRKQDARYRAIYAYSTAWLAGAGGLAQFVARAHEYGWPF